MFSHANICKIKLNPKMHCYGPTLAVPRKDKYNKKLFKYYVEHGDDDESGVEDVDTVREEQAEVGP